MRAMGTFSREKLSQKETQILNTELANSLRRRETFLRVSGDTTKLRAFVKLDTTMAIFTRASLATESRMESVSSSSSPQGRGTKASGSMVKWLATASISLHVTNRKSIQASSTAETSMATGYCRQKTSFIEACSKMENLMDLVGTRILKLKWFTKATFTTGKGVGLARSTAPIPIKRALSMKVTGTRARRMEKASNKFLHQIRLPFILLKEIGKMMSS